MKTGLYKICQIRICLTNFNNPNLWSYKRQNYSDLLHIYSKIDTFIDLGSRFSIYNFWFTDFDEYFELFAGFWLLKFVTDKYSAHIQRNLWHTTICWFLMIEIWNLSDRIKPTNLKFQTKEVNESMLMSMSLLAKSSAIYMPAGSKIIYHAASICEKICHDPVFLVSTASIWKNILCSSVFTNMYSIPMSDPAFT